ncbi:hypothetical protein FRC19_001605 [Serendipita sp. 401]|nr:hypothetical protein FRC19_001605 [Serendipita sp. 401]
MDPSVLPSNTWSRFAHYASLVTSILNAKFLWEEQFHLNLAVNRYLVPPVFPRLKHIRIAIRPPFTLPPILQGCDLEDVNILIQSSGSAAATVTSLGVSAPSIKSLQLNTDSAVTPEDISTMCQELRCFPKLQSLALVMVVYKSNFPLLLGELQNAHCLNNLTLYIMEGALLNSSQPLSTQLPELTRLSVAFGRDSAVLDILPAAPKLQLLSLIAHTLKDSQLLSSLIDHLPKYKQRSSFHALQISTITPRRDRVLPLAETLLNALLQLRQITCIRIMPDFRIFATKKFLLELAKVVPGLKELRLPGGGVIGAFIYDGDQQEDALLQPIPFDTVLKFTQECVLLEVLQLGFDARQHSNPQSSFLCPGPAKGLFPHLEPARGSISTPFLQSFSPHCSLQELSVDDSIIDYPLYIAEVIRKIFPRLSTLKYGNWVLGNEPSESIGLWKEVSKSLNLSYPFGV